MTGQGRVRIQKKVPVLGPAPTLSPSFRMAQAIFEPNLFPYTNTPTFSNPVSFHTYPPMKMEQTQCSETSAYKIQTAGNYPEENILSTFRTRRKFEIKNLYIFSKQLKKHNYQTQGYPPPPAHPLLYPKILQVYFLPVQQQVRSISNSASCPDGRLPCTATHVELLVFIRASCQRRTLILALKAGG